MKLASHQLDQQLQKSLAPLYFLSGDEPLQLQECREQIQQAAKKQGYDQRELIEADGKFDWSMLTGISQEMSLFSDLRIIDLRIDKKTIGLAGTKALRQWAEDLPPDIILIVSIPKMDKNQFSSKWMKAIDAAGMVIQIWPIEGERLNRWIESRMRDKGLIPEADVIPMLKELTEGNLLAANQEIEKLFLIHGPGVISAEPLHNSICDSASYSIFTLADNLLEGNSPQALRILNRLLEEATPATLILWAISKEIRLLATLSAEATRGNIQQLFQKHRVWSSRQALVTKALQRHGKNFWKRQLKRCHLADKTLKGQTKQDLELLLNSLVVSTCEGKSSHYQQAADLIL